MREKIDVPERIWVLERTGRYLSPQFQEAPPTEDQVVDGWTWHEYVRADPFPALGASAMQEAAVAIAKRYKDAALTRCDASEDRGEQATDGDENTANTAGSIEHYIRALPLPDHAAMMAEAMRLPEVQALVEAANGVVNRWDSPDWKSGHTLDFITRLRAAIAALPVAK